MRQELDNPWKINAQLVKWEKEMADESDGLPFGGNAETPQQMSNLNCKINCNLNWTCSRCRT
jgi:hypothetical protein